MPQIGWFELLLIIGLAVVIIGPKDFPIVLKKLEVGSVQSKDILVLFNQKFPILRKILLITRIKKTKIKRKI